MRKPHEMIVMVPRSRRVTLTGRRLYNALLQVSQARLAAMEGMPPADFMFEAPLPAILRTTGSNGEDRTAAKRYLKEMRGLEVDWESTAPGDGIKWRGLSMLSEVAIEVRNGENWVSWSYPPSIMAALREPTRWARLDLDVLAGLGSYPAVALYEICARYRDNPGGITSRKPVAWWADALSPAPIGAERREWRKFKNERLKSAIEDINTETDLEIELLEYKQGRTIVEAQFSVRKKRKATRSYGFQAVDANLVLRAESMGIREIKLEGLIKEFGDDKVRKQLEILEKRSSNQKLREVDHAYSYLRSLLRNGSDEVSEGVVQLNKELEELPRFDSTDNAVIAKPREMPAPPISGVDNEYSKERWERMREEIRALGEAERQILIEKVVTGLAEKGLMTAVITRRVAQGDILHGVLGAWVVRSYATSVYGAEWERDGADI